jgi:hypothetical protein
MSEANRSLSMLVAIGVAVAAIAGYLIGSRGSQNASGGGHEPVPAAQLRFASAAGVQLQTPADWSAAAAAPSLAGLSLVRPVLIAPGGDAAKGGLIAGELAAGEPSPLPASFVAGLKAPPRTDVVGLSRTEAFRYSNVAAPGFERPLTMYAIPNLGGDSTILGCFATAAAPASLSTCEQIVQTLRPVGQNGSGNLSPDASYAHAVGGVVSQLDAARTQIRREMSESDSPATVRTLAERLARDFATASSRLSPLEPPLVAGQAQAALARAVLSAQTAYAALAGAAGAQDVSRYEAARAAVTSGESGVSSALEGFALLGYGRG